MYQGCVTGGGRLLHLHPIILPSTGPMSCWGGGHIPLPGPMSLQGWYPYPVLVWGYPHPVLAQRGTPARSGWGYSSSGLDRVPPLKLDGGPPPIGTGWGYPSPPHPSGLDGGTPPKDSSKASTSYTAGGMPLAFTQEDFLVSVCMYTR